MGIAGYRISLRSTSAVCLYPSILAIATALAMPAASQCVPDPVSANATVTCSGADTDGIVISVPATVVVGSGASVANGVSRDAAISLASSTSGATVVTLTNNGSISSSAGAAMATQGDPTRIGLVALTNAAGASIIGVNGAINTVVGRLTNAGTIDGGAGSALTFPSSAGAIIFPASLSNSGSILSRSTAATIDYPFSPPQLFTNSGTIANSGTGLAIDGHDQSLNVVNAAGGVISSAGPTAISDSFQLTLTNAGTINGGIVATGAFPNRIDTTAGVINGAITFGNGNDRLIATIGTSSLVGNVSGPINGGGGTDLLELIVATDRTITDTTLPTNFEILQLDVTNGAKLTLSAPPPSGGYYVRGTGTVIVGTDMTTTGPAISPSYVQENRGLETLNFVNDRTIIATLPTSYSAAVSVQSAGTVTNTGTITGLNGVGLSVTNATSNTFTSNSGSITGSATGVTVSGRFENTGLVQSTAGVAVSNDLGGGVVRGLTSTNSGTVQGVTTGWSASSIVIVNSGTISASAGTGVALTGTTLDNRSGGVISGSQAAIQGDSFFGSYVANAGTINGNVNLGTVGSSTGAQSIFIDRGGVVNGNVTFGGGNDTFVTDLARAAVGVTGTIDGGGGFDTFRYRTAVNAQTQITPRAGFEGVGYEVANGATLQLGASNTVTTPITLSGTGSITINADLTGSSRALLDATVTSLPNYSGLGDDVQGNNLIVTSRGNLTFTAPASGQTSALAVVMGPTALGYAAPAVTSNFENAGTIDTGIAGMTAIRGWNVVTNSGTIILHGGAAVANANMFVNSGTVRQASDAPASGGVGSVTQVVNSGSITTDRTAIALLSGIYLGNSQLKPALTNSGIVTSKNDVAVTASDTLMFDNRAGGIITGTSAVLARGTNNTLTNAGSITGTSGAAIIANGGTHLDNSGTIVGTGGVAVQFTSANNTVTLRTGSTVTGAIVAGDRADSAILAGTTAIATSDQTVAAFSGFGSLSVQSGYWTGTAASTFNRITIAGGATLDDRNGATGLAISAGSIVDNGTLVVRSDATSAGSTFGASVVTGSGNVLLTGAGKAMLDGTNSIRTTGITTIDGGTTAILTGTQDGTLVTGTTGTLQIGTGGTVGSFTGNLVDNGMLVVNRSDDYTMTGGLSGTGTITKLGAGTLTFGDGYTFTGTTNILGGSIRLAGLVAPSTELDVRGNGRLDLSGTRQIVAELAGGSGAAVVNIAGGSLTVNQATTSTFAGSITGDGSFAKAGGGRLILSGVNSYTGPTTVSGGTLSVNGSIVSAATVAGGGTLGGNGTVGSVTVGAGGIIAPGNSIGTLTVAGNIAFAAGGIYQVEANAAGQADRIAATGTAALAGAVQVLPTAGNYGVLTNYVILSAAGGISGTFSSVTSSLAFLTPLLSYGANAVTLTLTRNDIRFASIATDANTAAVGAAIEARGLSDPLYNQVLGQSVAGAQAAFTSLSGEIHASLPTSLLAEGLEVGRLVRGHAATSGDGISIWGEGMYGLAESASRLGVAATRTDRRGGMMGIDVGREGLRAGLAAGALTSDLGVQGRASHADIDSKIVAAYAGFVRDALTIAGGISYSWHDVDTRRTASAGAAGGMQNAKYHANTTQFFGDVSYALTHGAVTFAPFVGYAHLRTRRNAFAETGSVAALVVSRSTRSLDVVEGGLRLDGTARIGLTTVLPHLAVSYQHIWGNTLGIEHAAFAGAGPGFTVVGARTGTDALRIEGGADIVAGRRFRLGGGAFGQTSGALGEYGAKMRASFTF
ncbi:autotransporter domain-containing protein [Sphingomonas sp. AP4-R1]|uniref:autotransporter domain-containing protein n=1 Tax=Sphingomonas sp. AP4-R1 TaxID=2735134 RepID=UPI00149329C6|nr:autotransporter domain-containing protein [Sphingomonas sp. AP4-R1]QJU59181.1 autotransporter domain-containing protein [Sphingomonas sp. AP4-R1]